MVPQEIPSEQWPESLDQFGRLHYGKPAQIALNDPAAGLRTYSDGEPLLGLVDERHDQVNESIAVIWGVSPGGTSSHSIECPVRVAIAEWNDGYSAILEIESAGGRCLRIQVGPVREMLPPGVITDGILLEKTS